MRRHMTYSRQAALSLWAPLFTVGITLFVSVAAQARQRRTWDFEMNPVGKAPDGFSFGRTGSGRMGRWVNNKIVIFLGWVITGIMTLAGVATIISLFIA